MVSLHVQNRNPRQNTSLIKRDGMIPAVYYGRTQEATPIAISLVDFQRVWKEAGESTVVTLKHEKGDLDALIYDVDYDPVKNTPRHADFYVFEEGKTIEVNVSLEFVGVSPVVKEKGAMLVKVLHEISVESLPRSLPNSLEVDISTLTDLDSQIFAKDIVLPEGVTLKEDPEEVVASVYEPQEEPEEEVADESVDFSAIEVEKKGKDEEDSEEGASE